MTLHITRNLNGSWHWSITIAGEEAARAYIEYDTHTAARDVGDIMYDTLATRVYPVEQLTWTVEEMIG